MGNSVSNSNTSVILQILSIIASFIVAAIALFKDWILLTFFPPKLRIETAETHGQIGVTDQNGVTPAVYYHLRVVNRRRKTLASACKVTLAAYQNQSHDGSWGETKVPVPPFFYWAPMENSDGKTDIFDFRRFDFLRVDDRNGRFSLIPRVNRTFSEMNWNVTPNTRVRYVLEIEGKNIPTRHQTWEVGWTGTWPYPDTNNVSIQEII